MEEFTITRRGLNPVLEAYSEYLSTVFSWLQTWGEVIGAIGSIVTGLLLAALYYLTFRTQNEQVETMESQADAMEEQLEWMESQQKPDIWIRDRAIYSGVLPPRAGDNDYVAVKLANEGTGVAKFLQARCDVWIERGGERTRLIKTEEEKFTVDNWSFTLKSGKWNLNRVDVSSPFHQRVHGDILQPNKEHWYFTEAKLMAHPDDDNGTSVSFQEAMLLLWAAGEERIMYQLTLLYRDPAGHLEGEKILSGQGNLREAFSLESFAPHGGFSGSVGSIVNSIPNNEYPPFE